MAKLDEFTSTATGLKITRLTLTDKNGEPSAYRVSQFDLDSQQQVETRTYFADTPYNGQTAADASAAYYLKLIRCN